ncbi:MAG: D-2-hydroxyacid dehydrogenase family protein [Acidimicrobiales bacterium]
MTTEKRVAVLDDYQGVALTSADWSVLDDRVSVDVWREHVSDEDQLVQALQDYEILVVMRERTPFPRSVIERLPNLELIVTTGPFNAAIDLAAAGDCGVHVCGTGATLPPTYELTWALILACVKQIPQSDRNVRAGGWQTRLGGDLDGARLGVLGLGRYGSHVARIGKAFNMDVVAWSQNLTEQQCREAGVGHVSKDELLTTSDVVTVHLVLSDRTRGLLDEAELASMKPTAYLINTSRGPIVDEDALARALAAGTIAGAGLDAFSVEPLPSDSPFLGLDNLIISPHMGYVTANTYEIFYRDAVSDIEGFLDGKIIRPAIAYP